VKQQPGAKPSEGFASNAIKRSPDRLASVLQRGFLALRSGYSLFDIVDSRDRGSIVRMLPDPELRPNDEGGFQDFMNNL
jgi:hypothetical protein